MTEEELYNEYRKSDCKSFTDFLINKIAELKKTYRKQRNKRIDYLQKENAEAKNLIEELASSLSVVGECDEEECELINKAQKFINKPIF
jgi:transcription initiation factor TFIIIB Brf1 subunit/transcription initiation factor TFIIB